MWASPSLFFGGEGSQPSAASSHTPHWSLWGWGFGEGKGVVPHGGEFGIAQSFVHVDDCPGLHVLLKELFALRGIFLSGDLGAVSFRGESIVCRGGRGERPVPVRAKAWRSSRVGGGSSQKCSPQSRDAGTEPQPQVPRGRWHGWDTHCIPGHRQRSGADPGTANPYAGWCSAGKSPGQTGCAGESASGASMAASTIHCVSCVHSPCSQDLL